MAVGGTVFSLRRSLVDLDRGVLFQALLYLPSKDVLLIRNACMELFALMVDSTGALKLWQHLETSDHSGLLAHDAIWLHATLDCSSIASVLAQTCRCILVQTCRLSALEMQNLVLTLQQNNRPFNPVHGACDGTILISPWMFENSNGCGKFPALGQISADGMPSVRAYSHALKLVADKFEFDVRLAFHWCPEGVLKLSWSARCCADPWDSDMDIELSGYVVSPCLVEIEPFGIIRDEFGQCASDFDCMDSLCESSHQGRPLICILRVVFRSMGTEHKALVCG